MFQSYDYDCGHLYECAAEIPNVRPIFFGCHFFAAEDHIFFEFPGTPEVFKCPVFSTIMIFQNFRAPLNFSNIWFFSNLSIPRNVSIFLFFHESPEFSQYLVFSNLSLPQCLDSLVLSEFPGTPELPVPLIFFLFRMYQFY